MFNDDYTVFCIIYRHLIILLFCLYF